MSRLGLGDVMGDKRAAERAIGTLRWSMRPSTTVSQAGWYNNFVPCAGPNLIVMQRHAEPTGADRQAIDVLSAHGWSLVAWDQFALCHGEARIP